MGKTPGQMQYLPVYIYNSVEDEWHYISGLKKKSEQALRITLSNAYADSYLFANAGRSRFVFVSPVSVSESFRTYFEGVSSSAVTIITPDMSRSPFISENLFHDSRALAQLLDIAKTYKEIHLYPYVATPQIWELQRQLTDKGVRVLLPESPAKNHLWTVSTYGSKTGFRELIASLPQNRTTFIMPEASIHQSTKTALESTYSTMQEKGAVLLKVSRGSGGHGTYILKKTDLNNTRDHIENILEKDPLWKQQKIVVEEFIETKPSQRIKYPNVECLIGSDGKNRILYCCNMLVTPEGNFYGMEVGPEALTPDLRKKLQLAGQTVGETYARNGYRGHFDIDMILGKNGNLYINESNTRNTGGTDAYKIAYYLLGERQFEKSFLLSKYLDLPQDRKLPSFEDLLAKIGKLLYSPKTKTGIILSSEASLKEHSVTYFIIARTRKQAYSIEGKLIKLLTP